MKKNVLFAMIICFASITGSFAQQKQSDGERKARFEKFKVEREAFLTKALELTDAEKAAFLPLSNELQMKKFELNKTLREEIHKIRQAEKDGKTVADVDYKKVIEMAGKLKIQEAQLEQEYTAKFLQVLPPAKVYNYRASEQTFGERMFKNRPDNTHARERAVDRIIERAQKDVEKARERAEKLQQRSEKDIERAQKRAAARAQKLAKELKS